MRPVSVAGLFALMMLAGCATIVDDRAGGSRDSDAPGSRPLVIAHRGASGYLPEHTLAAKAMAYAQGADYIEQDLVMTKDDEVVVLHDHHLDTVTNVREVFPNRARADGRYYVIDFTLAEIRTLAVSERFRLSDGPRVAVYKQRFPLDRSSFRVPTFAEEIELIQGLNQSTGGSVGIYPEIKSPAFHRGEGKDISQAVLEVLQAYGYNGKQDKVFLQCFDANELQRIHSELLPAMDMHVALVQLIGTGPEFQAALTPAGINAISSYADGIGPSINLVVDPDSVASNPETTRLVSLARGADLLVHPYTFRRDLLPAYAADYDELLEIFLKDIGVDGVFTDFPDLTVDFVESGL